MDTDENTESFHDNNGHNVFLNLLLVEFILLHNLPLCMVSRFGRLVTLDTKFIKLKTKN